MNFKDLLSIDGPTALSARNSTARWDAERLKDALTPRIKPPFQLEFGDKIFTVGSCFARNIEEQMGLLGFNLPMLDFTVPKEEHDGARAAGILNKYTPPSICQEFEWAAAILKRDGVVTEEDCKPFLYELPNGRAIDNNLADHISVSTERFYERRREIYDTFAHTFAADCVVITPGLVEAWWDNDREIFIQEVPWTRELREYLKRSTFVQLDYAASVYWLQRTVDCIRSLNPGAKILITTSPVPLGRTFTGEDIVVANTYAKSTLRAACGDICRRNANVGYFASYEMVMTSPRDQVWEDDGIHVQRSFVKKIVSNLGDIYFPNVIANLSDLTLQAARADIIREPGNAELQHKYGITLFQRGDALCINALSESVRLESTEERRFHLALAQSRHGNPETAQPLFDALLAGSPDNVTYLCASVECNLRAGAPSSALRFAISATTMMPSPDTFYWLGEAYLALQRFENAAAAARRGLAIEPTNVHCKGILDRATEAVPALAKAVS